jgi:hypothetical protein
MEILGLLLKGGIVTFLIVLTIWLFRYILRNKPKTLKQKFDKNGNLIENEVTYR